MRIVFFILVFLIHAVGFVSSASASDEAVSGMGGFFFTEIQRALESEASDALRVSAMAEDPRLAGRTGPLDPNDELMSERKGALHVLSYEEVQSLLGDDEALILVGHYRDSPVLRELGTEPAKILHEANRDRAFKAVGFHGAASNDEAFIVWAFTKSSVTWGRIEGTEAQLAEDVAALRCGLDLTTWADGGDACGRLLGGVSAPGAADMPPFPYARAHELFQRVFGRIHPQITGKRLFMVPMGPLAKLPPHVLITKPGATDGQSAAWLSRDFAVTILPSVVALKTLREQISQSHASASLVGFGNPLLAGDPSQSADDKDRAALAAQLSTCSTVKEVAQLAGRRALRAVDPIPLREGRADVELIRRQAPLPETADELCDVAQAVGASEKSIHLAAQATEAHVKSLSQSGTLASYRIVHFATHGLLAGQIDGVREPGLLLTPPRAATSDDDGYLSASEIAALKLDADMVVLSACNTASGGSPGGETLSGLARAFFAARARSILVSHWEVFSSAAAELVGKTFNELKSSPGIGRSEAMRRAMNALIAEGADPQTSFKAHPAYWAPFVLVGEDRAVLAAGTGPSKTEGKITAPAASPVPTHADAAAATETTDDVEYYVEGDYGHPVSYRETHFFKLTKIAGPDEPYRCKVGVPESVNIASVAHDERCSQIIATAADGPFVDAQGAPYKIGSVESENHVPIVVESPDGREIYKTYFPLRGSNDQVGFLLRGLKRAPEAEPSRHSLHFIVDPSQAYDVEILTPNGMPLSSKFKCSFDGAASAGSSNSTKAIVSFADGCKFSIKNAHEGTLWIELESTGEPAFSQRLMFELVREGWKPPVLEGLSFKMPKDAQLGEFRSWKTRIVERLQHTLKDKAAGAPVDDWFVDYLRQIEGELTTAMTALEAAP